jgi:uncharacterized protein
MMNTYLQSKYDDLHSRFGAFGRVVAAFSGGADSSLLIHSARAAVGRASLLAVTAVSETFPRAELDAAISFAKRYDIRHMTINTEELATINAKGNPRDRCYYCKLELFSGLKALAESEGYDEVIEGSNKDDEQDDRPGRRALSELGIISPLAEAGLAKSDVRDISRELGLPTWNKPAYACLTSRFPYGVAIEERSLRMIEEAEEYLRSAGFTQCRVRCFGERAVVEVEAELVETAVSMNAAIEEKLLDVGFKKVEIDPLGYRMGRMNER